MTWRAAESSPPEDALPTDRSKVAFAASGASVIAPTTRYSRESPYRAHAPVPGGIALVEPHGTPSPDGILDSLSWCASDGEPWRLQLLPVGLMYRSYLAGPREPRFGYEWLYDTNRERWVNEVALGGRMGVLRFGNRDPQTPQGWQLDIEGAAFPRLAAGSLDLIAADFRFGIPLTLRQGPYQAKLAFYHLSSHAGDEFLINAPPDFTRINFSRNALVLGAGYYLLPDFRLYTEVGYGLLNDGGNQPWEFQFGAEYRPSQPTGLWGAPFWAVNAHLREEVDFGGSFTPEAGWAWRGLNSGHLFRAGFQYFNGHTRQFEFLGRTEELVGMGIWSDF